MPRGRELGSARSSQLRWMHGASCPFIRDYGRSADFRNPRKLRANRRPASFSARARGSPRGGAGSSTGPGSPCLPSPPRERARSRAFRNGASAAPSFLRLRPGARVDRSPRHFACRLASLSFRSSGFRRSMPREATTRRRGSILLSFRNCANLLAMCGCSPRVRAGHERPAGRAGTVSRFGAARQARMSRRGVTAGGAP